MKLSRRQQEIVDLLSNDMCRKEIAAHLGLCKQTVDCHISRIRQKLPIKTDCGLVAWNYRNKIAEFKRPCCPECAI
jgi:DNA-binding NarL/FixJ family response regulator